MGEMEAGEEKRRPPRNGNDAFRVRERGCHHREIGCTALHSALDGMQSQLIIHAHDHSTIVAKVIDGRGKLENEGMDDDSGWCCDEARCSVYECVLRTICEAFRGTHCDVRVSE
jgi:hypothetical protein